MSDNNTNHPCKEESVNAEEAVERRELTVGEPPSNISHGENVTYCLEQTIIDSWETTATVADATHKDAVKYTEQYASAEQETTNTTCNEDNNEDAVEEKKVDDFEASLMWNRAVTERQSSSSLTASTQDFSTIHSSENRIWSGNEERLETRGISGVFRPPRLRQDAFKHQDEHSGEQGMGQRFLEDNSACNEETSQGPVFLQSPFIERTTSSDLVHHSDKDDKVDSSRDTRNQSTCSAPTIEQPFARTLNEASKLTDSFSEDDERQQHQQERAADVTTNEKDNRYREIQATVVDQQTKMQRQEEDSVSTIHRPSLREEVLTKEQERLQQEILVLTGTRSFDGDEVNVMSRDQTDDDDDNYDDDDQEAKQTSYSSSIRSSFIGDDSVAVATAPGAVAVPGAVAISGHGRQELQQRPHSQGNLMNDGTSNGKRRYYYPTSIQRGAVPTGSSTNREESLSNQEEEREPESGLLSIVDGDIELAEIVATTPPLEQSHSNDLTTNANSSTHDSMVDDEATVPEAVVESAHFYNDVPMLTAELVTTPIHVYQVHIDTDHEHDQHYHHHHQQHLSNHQRPESARSPSSPISDTVSSSSSTHKTTWTSKCLWLSIGAILASAIVTGISLPLTLSANNRKRQVASNSSYGWPPPPNDSNPPPDGHGHHASSQSYAYPCYRSTLDILNDQLSMTNLPDAFIMCPNTYISVGTLADPNIHDNRIIDGDYPLMAIRENVTIQCGMDGRRENNCILDGGWIQVLTAPFVDHPSIGQITCQSTDHFTIRGFTFVGSIESSYPLSGVSVQLWNPGRNMVLQDCAWMNMTAPQGVIHIGQEGPKSDVQSNYVEGQTPPPPLAGQSVDMTLQDCAFHSIVYDYQLIGCWNQSVAIQTTVFSDIQLSHDALSSCNSSHSFGGGGGSSSGGSSSSSSSVATTASSVSNGQLFGCRGTLLFCQEESWCSISGLCVRSFDLAGPSPIMISNDTIWSSQGMNAWMGGLEDATLANSPWTRNVTTVTTNSTITNSTAGMSNASSDFCGNAIAQMDGTTVQNYTCLTGLPIFQFATCGG